MHFFFLFPVASNHIVICSDAVAFKLCCLSFHLLASLRSELKKMVPGDGMVVWKSIENTIFEVKIVRKSRSYGGSIEGVGL